MNEWIGKKKSNAKVKKEKKKRKKKGKLQFPNSTVASTGSGHGHFSGFLLSRKDKGSPIIAASSDADSNTSLFAGFHVSHWPLGAHSSHKILPPEHTHEGWACRKNAAGLWTREGLCFLLPGHGLLAQIIFSLENFSLHWGTVSWGYHQRSTTGRGSLKLVSVGHNFW